MSSVGGTGAPRQRQESDLEHRLRSVDVDLARSKSMKQPKIKGGMMKTLRKKLGEAMSKLIIYERLPMNLSNSPWLHNLLTATADLGPGIIYPTPYEISEVYLENEYKFMKSWINELKPTWKERGVIIMCDGWTNGINHMDIMNFLVYCSKGIVFLKSVDASRVASRNTEYYVSLLDKVVDEVREENVVQVVTDNEKELKAAGYFLNPQFQFGIVHGSDVAKETMDGTTKLLLFWDKQEAFGTLQAQRAWCQMNPGKSLDPLNGGWYMDLVLMSFKL
ncbi:uncharacterized protein LOC130719580 [Lotus japonicus]|uniref:uncharacterized protein LOC130719580 n=1 Tax=Lotus japonicus TaxID=34305 RepID=UPI0025895C76|nr:uncharacterized protein LOC130719580 [Lotus japonicus]